MSITESSLDLNLLELPPELLQEIFKRLDLKSIQNVSKTCKLLETMITTFKATHKEFIENLYAKERFLPAGYYDDTDDYDSEYYHDAELDADPPHYHDDLDDLERLGMDNFSQGSFADLNDFSDNDNPHDRDGGDVQHGVTEGFGRVERNEGVEVPDDEDAW